MCSAVCHLATAVILLSLANQIPVCVMRDMKEDKVDSSFVKL